MVPGALAVALLVFGGYLAVAPRRPRSAAAPATARTGIRHFESHPEPVFVTDLDGRVARAQPGRPPQRRSLGRRAEVGAATG